MVWMRASSKNRTRRNAEVRALDGAMPGKWTEKERNPAHSPNHTHLRDPTHAGDTSCKDREDEGQRGRRYSASEDGMTWHSHTA